MFILFSIRIFLLHPGTTFFIPGSLEALSQSPHSRSITNIFTKEIRPRRIVMRRAKKICSVVWSQQCLAKLQNYVLTCDFDGDWRCILQSYLLMQFHNRFHYILCCSSASQKVQRLSVFVYILYWLSLKTYWPVIFDVPKVLFFN